MNFEEMKGKNGFVIGSDEYFRDINEKELFGCFMGEMSGYKYYDALKDLMKSVEKGIDEAYNDLKNNSRLIRYTDSRTRKRMENVIENLDELYKKSNSTLFRVNDCINMLTLSDKSTDTYSGKRESDIADAAKRAENYGNGIGKYDAVKIFERAADYGSGYYSDGSKERAFLDYVCPGRKNFYYRDVAAYIKYKKENEKIYGKNGEYLLSDRYIKRVERDIFGSKAVNHRDFPSEGNYRRAIESSLNNIAGKINRDFEEATNFKGYWLCSEHKNRIDNCVMYLCDCKTDIYRHTIEYCLKNIYTNNIDCIHSDFRLAKYFEAPSRGVEGWAVEVMGGGIGLYGSFKPILVIDSNRDYGFVLDYSAGFGTPGFDFDIDHFVAEDVPSVSQIVGDYYAEESLIGEIGYGPASVSVECEKGKKKKGVNISNMETLKLVKDLPSILKNVKSEAIKNGHSIGEEFIEMVRVDSKGEIRYKKSGNIRVRFRNFKPLGRVERRLY